MPRNADKQLQKTWAGIQLILGEMRDLRADTNSRLDRWEKQAAEDRKAAAEDRRHFAQVQDDLRKALIIIGRRGGEFVEIQKKQGEQIGHLIAIQENQGRQLDKIIDIQEKQGEQLDRIIDISRQNTAILKGIHRLLRSGPNGRRNGRRNDK